VWNSLVVSKHAELHNITFTIVHGGVYRLTEWECKQRLYRDIIEWFVGCTLFLAVGKLK